MENENANPHLYDAREQQERIAFLERPLAFDAGRKRPLLLGDDLIGVGAMTTELILFPLPLVKSSNHLGKSKNK